MHTDNNQDAPNMNPFKRLPGSRREPSGPEWTLLKKMPLTLLLGALACAAAILLLQLGWFGYAEEAALRAQFAIAGALMSWVIIMLTVTLGCAIVVVMKGHAYVWDAYYLPEQLENGRPKQK